MKKLLPLLLIPVILFVTLAAVKAVADFAADSDAWWSMPLGVTSDVTLAMLAMVAILIIIAAVTESTKL